MLGARGTRESTRAGSHSSLPTAPRSRSCAVPERCCCAAAGELPACVAARHGWLSIASRSASRRCRFRASDVDSERIEKLIGLRSADPCPLPPLDVIPGTVPRIALHPDFPVILPPGRGGGARGTGSSGPALTFQGTAGDSHAVLAPGASARRRGDPLHHPSAVTGSIILRTSVTMEAGNPLRSACSWISASSSAR